ncbi:hypothetical protein [Qipengyuania aestuarii]|uniref:hypothetical protein n=1 Tax=Qipengyuania aestuarii TaxID=2867241 RepID=UPI001FFCDF51|nr:hypothetical protein [Qipengyuania aestuarii]
MIDNNADSPAAPRAKRSAATPSGENSLAIVLMTASPTLKRAKPHRAMMMPLRSEGCMNSKVFFLKEREFRRIAAKAIPFKSQG